MIKRTKVSRVRRQTAAPSSVIHHAFSYVSDDTALPNITGLSSFSLLDIFADFYAPFFLVFPLFLSRA